jgi:hypothetical protein
LTVNLLAFINNEADIIDRIYEDNRHNPHGLSLVGIDPDNQYNDCLVKTFDTDKIVDSIVEFFARTNCEDARIWLHQRMATGTEVHIGTMHGFHDRHGNIVMHNGIFGLGNGSRYAVDSYAISDLVSTDMDGVFIKHQLAAMCETFSNIFIIRPATCEYTVIRMRAGSLYTDGLGNYSTKAVASINIPVEHDYAQDFYHEGSSFGSELDEYEESAFDYYYKNKKTI